MNGARMGGVVVDQTKQVLPVAVSWTATLIPRVEKVTRETGIAEMQNRNAAMAGRIELDKPEKWPDFWHENHLIIAGSNEPVE
jgi:hypothetical protein